jgi:L-fuconolactonase
MIDSHQHFWKYNPLRDAWITKDMSRIRRDFYPSDCVDIFLKNGINACVAIQADSSEEETFFLLSLSEQSEFIQGVVAWVDLRAKNIEDRLTYFSQFEKIKGFRHVVQSETDPKFLSNPEFLRGVSLLNSFDFSYDLLIYSNQLESGIDFCKKNENQRIVLDHLAKPPIKSGNISEWKKFIYKFKDLENVSAKISGLITEAEWFNWDEKDIVNIIDVSLEVFGSDRLMFGTDFPVVLVAEELSTWIDTFNRSISKLTVKEINKITVENCCHFYKLEL